MSASNNPEAIQKQSNGRKVLLLLMLIFVLPFTMALILHELDIRPSGKSFGNLITPPISLSIPALKDAYGETFTVVNWQKKWSIVVIASDGCDDTCQVRLDLLSRVHITLNKDIKRVQRILILPTQIAGNAIADLQKKFPDLVILSSADENVSQFVGKFESIAPPQSVYLVDPLGNLMMQYPQNIDPKGLRGDLVRLLKNSWAA